LTEVLMIFDLTGQRNLSMRRFSFCWGSCVGETT